MLRSSRTIASLIRALTWTSAATIATATAATVLVSCKDESQPEYWTDKLDDVKWRPRAVKRLEQFFEDAVTKANKDTEAKQVKDLLAKVREPLMKTYIEHYDNMDTKTRVSVIKLLAAFRDPQTEPALKKAFEEFAKNPRSTKDEQDIKWAARAASDLELAGLADPILNTYLKFKASTQLGGITYKDFSAAMVEISDKAWVGPLKAKLAEPIKKPKDAKDRDLIDPFRDQLFWQTTAAQVLGEIGDPAAVEALLKVLLDPEKVDVHATALMALVKIGKPAADQAAALLKGKADKLQAFQIKRIKEISKSDKTPEGEPWVPVGALVIGTIGRQDGIPVLIDALKKEKDESSKAVITRELTKIPPTRASKEAFKSAFESISLDTQMPAGGPALIVLADDAAHFFDPGMIDWLLDQAESAKGGGQEKKALQQQTAVTVLKLAKPDQMKKAAQAINKYGEKAEKDALALAESLTKACTDRVACYLAAIEKGENQDKDKQFAGIKAGYMAAIFGNEQTRDALIERLDAIDNAAVRFIAAQAIDHLSTKGSKAAAEKLDRIIKKNLKTADTNKIQGDRPLKQVMYRIESRAR